MITVAVAVLALLALLFAPAAEVAVRQRYRRWRSGAKWARK